MRKSGKRIARVCMILAAMLLAPLLMGLSMSGDDAAMGFPTDITEDFGKCKPGLEVILNKMDDQRKETWFVEMHYGAKPKHIELSKNVDLMGRVTNVLAKELTRADFKVIPGNNEPDPVRPVISGAVTRYSVVYKQVYTGEISLDIVLTKGDNILLKQTYVGFAEQEAIKFPTPKKAEEINAKLLRKAWDQILSKMMPELINIINENS